MAVKTVIMSRMTHAADGTRSRNEEPFGFMTTPLLRVVSAWHPILSHLIRAHGILDDPLLRGLGVRDLRHDPALPHDVDPIAHADDLGKLGRDHQNGGPFLDEFVHEGVDLGLGPHIDAARRLVEDEDLGLGAQPLGQDHLLLVAPREILGQSRGRGGGDAQLLDILHEPSAFSLVVLTNRRGNRRSRLDTTMFSATGRIIARP